MCPTYIDNDYIVALKWPTMRLRVGDVVVINHPQLKLILKRISAISASDGLLLSGDNEHSISTAEMGWVANSAVIGRAIFRIPAMPD